MRKFIRIPIKILLSPVHLLLNIFLLLSKTIIDFAVGIMTLLSVFFFICIFINMHTYGMQMHMLLPPTILTLMFSPIGIPLIIMLIQLSMESIRNLIRKI